MVTVPLLGGVKLYQTLAESWSEVHDATGSEPAAVASVVLRVSVNGAAAITFGVPHSSFMGEAATASARCSTPLAERSIPVTSRRYVVPAVAAKATLDWRPPAASSLHAISTGAPHVPVYTVNCVSKLVPKVLAVILPLVAAVKLYHRLRAFLSLVHECIGSDAAVVAVDVSTVAANGTAPITVGVAQSSFAGWAFAPGV